MHSETKVAVHALNSTTKRCWLVSMPGLIQAAFSRDQMNHRHHVLDVCQQFELLKRPGRDNGGKLQWLFSLISNATR